MQKEDEIYLKGCRVWLEHDILKKRTHKRTYTCRYSKQ